MFNENKSEVIDMVLTEYDEEKTMSALKRQYLNQGKITTIISIINQGLLTKEQGAQQLGIPVSELGKLLKQ